MTTLTLEAKVFMSYQDLDILSQFHIFCEVEVTNILSSFARHWSTDYPSGILRSSSLAFVFQLPYNLFRLDLQQESVLKYDA